MHVSSSSPPRNLGNLGVIYSTKVDCCITLAFLSSPAAKCAMAKAEESPCLRTELCAQLHISLFIYIMTRITLEEAEIFASKWLALPTRSVKCVS